VADIVSKEKRSRMMAGIRGKNTKPEIVVRKMLFANGYRFRINKRIGNVRPDIILPKWSLCIFVHGCFWHQHPDCKLASRPKTNTEFWDKKFADNTQRDMRNLENLTNLGWKVEVIWECETKDKIRLASRLKSLF
jgi:DNA mismatch endonuclease (patch repair protein)